MNWVRREGVASRATDCAAVEARRDRGENFGPRVALGELAELALRRRALGHREAPQGQARGTAGRGRSTKTRLNSRLPRQVDQARVHLGLGPVARDVADRAEAERVEPRQRLAIFDLLADDAGDRRDSP